MLKKLTAQNLRKAKAGDTFEMSGKHPVFPGTKVVYEAAVTDVIEEAPDMKYTMELRYKGALVHVGFVFLADHKGAKMEWGV